mmetsp:Transcript_13560/g.40910  ORF Transcript_13560/g.40910 Transcript_13560/m.40910 type:complete len:432 (-) Transcript_13560:2331-3626(-)
MRLRGLCKPDGFAATRRGHITLVELGDSQDCLTFQLLLVLLLLHVVVHAVGEQSTHLLVGGQRQRSAGQPLHLGTGLQQQSGDLGVVVTSRRQQQIGTTLVDVHHVGTALHQAGGLVRVARRHCLPECDVQLVLLLAREPEPRAGLLVAGGRGRGVCGREAHVAGGRNRCGTTAAGGGASGRGGQHRRGHRSTSCAGGRRGVGRGGGKRIREGDCARFAVAQAGSPLMRVLLLLLLLRGRRPMRLARRSRLVAGRLRVLRLVWERLVRGRFVGLLLELGVCCDEATSSRWRAMRLRGGAALVRGVAAKDGVHPARLLGRAWTIARGARVGEQRAGIGDLILPGLVLVEGEREALVLARSGIGQAIQCLAERREGNRLGAEQRPEHAPLPGGGVVHISVSASSVVSGASPFGRVLVLLLEASVATLDGGQRG